MICTVVTALPENPSPDLFLTKMVLTEKMKQRIVRIKRRAKFVQSSPPAPHIILLHTFATAETLKYNDRKSNESLFDLLMFFGQNERNTMKKQIINSIFTKPSKHYVFSLAQPLVFSLSFLVDPFLLFTKWASSGKKETNLRMGNFFRH